MDEGRPFVGKKPGDSLGGGCHCGSRRLDLVLDAGAVVIGGANRIWPFLMFFGHCVLPARDWLAVCWHAKSEHGEEQFDIAHHQPASLFFFCSLRLRIQLIWRHHLPSH